MPIPDLLSSTDVHVMLDENPLLKQVVGTEELELELSLYFLKPMIIKLSSVTDCFQVRRELFFFSLNHRED